MPPKVVKSKEEVESIAHATVSLLEPEFESSRQLISSCAKSVDLNKAKANILCEHYRLDNVD